MFNECAQKEGHTHASVREARQTRENAKMCAHEERAKKNTIRAKNIQHVRPKHKPAYFSSFSVFFGPLLARFLAHMFFGPLFGAPHLVFGALFGASPFCVARLFWRTVGRSFGAPLFGWLFVTILSASGRPLDALKY